MNRRSRPPSVRLLPRRPAGTNVAQTRSAMRPLIFSSRLLLVFALAVSSCSSEREPLTQGSLAHEPATELPSECSAHDSFRHGFPFAVSLRVGDGPEALFLVDTGCSKTTLDTSFEPSLGPSLRKELVINLETGTTRQKVFGAPRLYLGNTRVMSGDTVLTGDVCGPEDCPYKGILGMDCLSHYCIQIDFAAGRLRFLDSAHLQREALGTPFPVVACSLRRR